MEPRQPLTFAEVFARFPAARAWVEARQPGIFGLICQPRAIATKGGAFIVEDDSFRDRVRAHESPEQPTWWPDADTLVIRSLQ